MQYIVKCDHVCINQPLGAKVESPGQRKIANAFTVIPIRFKYLIANANSFGSIKRSVESCSMKIVIQCCAYLNNDEMHQVVGLCKYSHQELFIVVLYLKMVEICKTGGLTQPDTADSTSK